MRKMWDAALVYIAGRMQEPSTWTALGLIFTGAGVGVSPERWQGIMMIGLIGFGAIGAALGERKKTTPAEIKTAVDLLVKPEAKNPEAPTVPELAEAMKQAAANGSDVKATP